MAATGTTNAEVEIRPSVRLVAPVIAFGATMAMRKLMERTYKKTAGQPVPHPHDLRVSLTRTLTWSVATAVVMTLVEVVIVRGIDRAGAKPTD